MRPARPARRAGLTRVGAAVLFVLLGGGWVLLGRTVLRVKQGAGRPKCSNNLRQLGLAAVQYADDRRAFPHVRGARELDGGADSPDTPRKVRALVWAGYHDNPEGWLCPESSDRFVPLAAAARANMKAWRWGGRSGPTEPSPLAGDTDDPTLLATDELSYGWSRRTFVTTVRGTAELAADRALRDEAGAPRGTPPGLVGNHAEGFTLLTADASVTWVPLGDARAADLAAIDRPASPALTVAPAPPGARAPAPPPAVSRAQLEQAAWLLGPPLALLALLLAATARARTVGVEAPPPAP